ncbi:oligopeptide/dipeptide ABC transporter ATP-binding protein [Telmatospirillum siberiense]|nr:ABC transporter ATP-binding protein [Telmatospirillum siberiense]
MNTLLEIEDLHVAYGLGSKRRSVLDGVSLTVDEGETVGVIGESGCGKSTLAKTIVGLAKIGGGSVCYRGTDVRTLSGPSLKEYGRRVQMVFQNSLASLNPRKTVFQTLETPLIVHGERDRRSRRRRIEDIADRVGLPNAMLQRRPHELSGGQRQRVGIGRALILNPQLVICDEPVSALDVSIQAQILNLLSDLRREQGLSYLFISHDLGVVRFIADRIFVIFAGRIIETADYQDLWRDPRHPYTRLLLAASLGESTPDRPGSPPPPSTGCRFRHRCPFAFGLCAEETPVLRDIGGGHRTACHLG